MEYYTGLIEKYQELHSLFQDVLRENELLTDHLNIAKAHIEMLERARLSNEPLISKYHQ